MQRTNSELNRELSKEDFKHQNTQEISFPRQGRKTPPETHPHASGDFKWKVSSFLLPLTHLFIYGSFLESEKLGGGFNFLKLSSFQGVRRGYKTGLP